MEYYNYADLGTFLHDKELKDDICIDLSFEYLLEKFTKDDFLEIDTSMRIPFFAETRNYVGAREKNNPDARWMVKPIKAENMLQHEMAMIVYYIDFFTRSISAPSIVTKLNNTLYRATKIVYKAEQLSGANYTENRQLREQLILDLINRWIYYDEDRNPNNYMIRYNSRNDQIIIAVDFVNADLLDEGIKISGETEHFGWKRMEKTRYLTPLKSDNFLIYDMTFFNIRFDYFKQLNSKLLAKCLKSILRFNPDKNRLTKKITSNLLKRRDYVYEYFDSKFPLIRPDDVDVKKYDDMGETFKKMYNKYG